MNYVEGTKSMLAQQSKNQIEFCINISRKNQMEGIETMHAKVK